MATKQKRPWKIALFQPDLREWKVLARFKSEVNAQDKIEGYCKRYPNGWVDILDPAYD